MEGGLADPDDLQFERDTARAQAKSREETPQCVTAEEVIQLGIMAAAKRGIFCTAPNLPLVDNRFVPMDGNCIQSCCCHANDPSLSGNDLKQAAWELRLRGVGTAIESLKNFTDLQWEVLQAIITGSNKTLSRENIRLELEQYMESGVFSGNFGDVLPQLAADTLNQPLLVIVVENGQVKSTTWVDPGGIFGGGNLPKGDPIVVVKQLQHFEPLLIMLEAKEVAKLKYEQWTKSGRVGVTGGEEVPERGGCSGD